MEVNKQELLDKALAITEKFNELRDYVDAFRAEVTELDASETVKDVLSTDLSDLSDTLRYFMEDNFGNEMEFLIHDIEKLDSIDEDSSLEYLI